MDSPYPVHDFNFFYGAAPPVEAEYELGSWVNLHPGVMVRGDGLHLATLWQNCLGDLCPSGQDIVAPTDVRGCPVPMGRPVAMTRLSPIEATPWVLPLGRPGHEQRCRPLGFRDYGDDSCPRHLPTILEEEKLELELAMKESRLGDYNNDEECMDSPQALDVEVLGQA